MNLKVNAFANLTPHELRVEAGREGSPFQVGQPLRTCRLPAPRMEHILAASSQGPGALFCQNLQEKLVRRWLNNIFLSIHIETVHLPISICSLFQCS